MKAHDPPIKFQAKDRRIRCFTHIINIIVQHTLSFISESCAIVDSPEQAEDEFASEDPTAIPISKDEQNLEDAAAHDLVGRARTLVCVLRASNSRRSIFRRIIATLKTKGDLNKEAPCELLEDVKSRWDSTYHMIHRLRCLRPVRPFSHP